MKIGFSLGRCVRDIVTGDVSIDDVAFIIAATAIRDSEKQLEQVINDYLYRPNYLDGLDAVKCQEVAKTLYESNRIIQPRLQGMHRHMQPESAVWVDLFPTIPTQKESVKSAWDAYRFMLHMVENVESDALETFKR